MKRRTVDFRSADEIIRDINLLRAQGYEMTGKWNLTQICQHLTGTMDGGMDGFGFRVPWILRATIIEWGYRYALKKRKLGSGFPTIKILRPTHSDAADNDTLIDACIASCQRVDTFSGSLEDYALLDNLSVDDWRNFMWIHAAHHLSFLIPKDASVEGDPQIKLFQKTG